MLENVRERLPFRLHQPPPGPVDRTRVSGFRVESKMLDWLTVSSCRSRLFWKVTVLVYARSRSRLYWANFLRKADKPRFDLGVVVSASFIQMERVEDTRLCVPGAQPVLHASQGLL